MSATMSLVRGEEEPLVIYIRTGKERRPLFIFPNKESISKAVTWCDKKEMNSRAAAKALISHCKKQGAKQIGRKLPKCFLEFAGIKCFKIEANNLTPKRG